MRFGKTAGRGKGGGLVSRGLLVRNAMSCVCTEFSIFVRRHTVKRLSLFLEIN